VSDDNGQASLGSTLVEIGSADQTVEPASEPTSGTVIPASGNGLPATDPASGSEFSAAVPASASGAPTPAVARPTHVPSAASAPSWGRVLATTIRLWLRRRWQVLAAIGIAAAVALTVLAISGAFSSGRGPAVQPRPASQPSAHKAAPPTPQAEAATWIASQVSGDAIIACDPAACTALQSQGVSAARLMPLTLSAPDPQGAAVVVTASSAPAVTQYAPAVIASFGTGAAQIDVRAAEAGGAAAYQSALQSDLAARQAAGTQLLKNNRITFTAQDAVQLQAGEVDSRVLATLAALASQHSFTVAAFGDAAPGAAILYREVFVTSSSTADLAAELALVKAQVQPYLPAQAKIVPAGAGLGVLTVGFAAPSPLGLLTAVLDAAQLTR